MSNEKSELVEDFETIRVGNLLQELEDDSELQRRAFGKTFTKEEFKSRFREGITPQDLVHLANIKGLNLKVLNSSDLLVLEE